MAYGDTFSAVESAALNEENMRRNALARSFQNMMAGSQFAAQQLNTNRQMDLNDKYFGLQRDYMSNNPQNRRQAMALAYQDANEGAFDTPEHVTALYPELGPELASSMWERSDRARQLIQAEYAQAQAAANAMTQYQQAQTGIPVLKKQVAENTPGFFSRMNPANLFYDDPRAASLEDYQRQLSEQEALVGSLGPVITELRRDPRRLSEMIAYDPTTGGYGPSPTLVPRFTVPPRAVRPGQPAAGGPRGVAPNAGPTPVPAPAARGMAPVRPASAGTNVNAMGLARNVGGAFDYSTQPGAGRPTPGPGIPATNEPAATGTSADVGRHSPQFYQRVRQLIDMGVPGLDALTQTQSEGLR